MKATVSRAELLRVIEVTERAVNGKSSMPILGSLMLEVNCGTLEAIATDLEMTLEASCRVVEGSSVDGKVAVVGDTFASVVKAIAGELIDLEETKKGLVVKAGRSRYTVPMVVNESWPVLPYVEPLHSFDLSEDLLRLTLEKVLPAAGTDTSRAYLCGTMWRVEPERLTLVGTDTHRLHVSGCRAQMRLGAGVEMLVGSRPCKELLRFLAGESLAEVWTDGSCLRVRAAFGIMTVRLTAGTYPNYARFVPEVDAYLKVDKKELADALKRAGIVANACADRVVIRHDRTVEISCHADDGGVAEESVALLDAAMEAGGFAVSGKNLLMAVQAVPDEVVTLKKAEGLRPVFVCGEDANRYFGVLTPMHLPEGSA